MPSSYTLGGRYEAMIRKLVTSGRYASASEVVRDGLRLIEEREQVRAAKLSNLKRAIKEGLTSGPSEPLDMNAIKREARAAKSKTARRVA
jgi:antitoxin ParD1/3/4